MPNALPPRKRGGLISLLISIQLLALDILTRLALKQLLRWLAQPSALWTEAIHLATVMLLSVCLWLYYDSIDDSGFADFCQSRNARPLWDIPAHGAGLTVAVLTVSPVLCFPLHSLLAEAGLPRIPSALLAAAGAVGFTVGGRILLLTRLRVIWAAQKELVTGREKRRSTLSRVLYAVVFFLSLALAVWCGLAVCGHQIIKYARIIPDMPLWLIVTVLAVILADRLTRLTVAILARRRFLSRLGQLADRGRIAYTVEGHPYLSLLSSRFYVGVTVIHTVSVNRLQQQRVYRVGLIGGGRKRSVIILCPGQVYRILHRLPAQNLIPRMDSRGRMLGKPPYAWFENHAFDFPEGEGELVLLAEPFPAVLAGQGDQEDWFFELYDGASVFGYTAYSPNSFLHLLERA